MPFEEVSIMDQRREFVELASHQAPLLASTQPLRGRVEEYGQRSQSTRDKQLSGVHLSVSGLGNGVSRFLQTFQQMRGIVRCGVPLFDFIFRHKIGLQREQGFKSGFCFFLGT